MRPSLSISQARRLALAAAGLHQGRPSHKLDRRHVRGVVERLGLVQIDSVNVLARAHLVPFFSRLGPYDTGTLGALTGNHRELFEYWGHEASLLPVTTQPLVRWRMRAEHAWGRMRRLGRERPELLDQLEATVLAEGPRSAGELRTGTRPDQPGPRTDSAITDRVPGASPAKGPRTDSARTDQVPAASPEKWWGWDEVKVGLELLFWTGRLGVLRRPSFERVYVPPEMAVPSHVLGLPTPAEVDAKKELLSIAAAANGVGTAADLADHFRLPLAESRALLHELVGDGRLTRVEVEGWPEQAYTAPDASVPRRATGATLVSPFDPVMWFRPRAARLFGFDYAIEIYVPAAKRRYGYYVLPFLLGERFVARVDLKADRAGRRLLVRSAWGECDIDDAEVAEALAAELRALAGWLGLESTEVEPRGDLSVALRAAVVSRER